MKRAFKEKKTPQEKRGEEYTSSPPMKKTALHNLPSEPAKPEWTPYDAKAARRMSNISQKYQGLEGMTKKAGNPPEVRNVHNVPKSLKAKKSSKTRKGKKRIGLEL
ncbi:MAG TPA: hypothetical protein VLG44_05965 [Chlamydiales bacterium]|nr:hypothetical protein [Chlamydiales bacterium]